MSRDNSHFPTFRRMSNLGGQIGRGATGLAGVRSGSLELGLLRLALYGLLVLSILHTVTLRFALIGMGGMGRFAPWQPQPMDFGWLTPVLYVTSLVFGPMESNNSLLILTLSLVGLATSSRQSLGVPPAVFMEPIEKNPTSDHRHLAEPLPAPPERHPLDPDPDDLPAEPRWPKR